MKITDLLSKDAIKLNGIANSKQDAINKLVDLMAKNGNLTDKEKYTQVVLKREEEGSTGIGEGIAIPHGKTDAVSKPGLSAMVINDGVEFDSLDGQPAKLLFLIAAPNTKDNVHLDVLSRLSTLLMDTEFRKSLMEAKTPEEFLRYIDIAENAKLSQTKKNDEYEILAITSCPTGIAHTYMAAEALEKMGEQLGHKVKVETHGSSGVKNKFTKEEIKNAKAVIIAADTKIDLSRFDGKKLIKAKVADGINRPQELIERVLSSDAKIYHSSNKSQNSDSDEKEGFGTKIYKHLMNGISHALPFLVASGVLYGILYLVKDQVLSNQSLTLINYVQQLITIMIIPIVSAYIADSIADRPAMVSGFAGGLIVCQGISMSSISANSTSLLAGIVAGFLAGFVSLILKKLFSYLPQCLKGIEASLFHPVLSTVIVLLVMIYLNGYLYIAHSYILQYVSLVESQMSTKILFGFVLGMMMAIDNGGPINKTAYVFGIGMLISYDYYPMAAVMAGGMIPPFVIALTATLSKNRFSNRKDALMNYINGISFISEGAIPFIQQESTVILPACCLAAGLAGALSMYFECSITSPHGGLFLIWMVNNPLYYLALIVLSTVVGTLLLFIFTKLKNNVK